MIITVPTTIVTGKEETDVTSGEDKFVIKEKVQGAVTFSLKDLSSYSSLPLKENSGLLIYFKDGGVQKCSISLEEFEIILYGSICNWFKIIGFEKELTVDSIIEDSYLSNTTIFEWYLYLKNKYGNNVEGNHTEDSEDHGFVV